MTIYFHIYERVVILLASIVCVFALWVVAEFRWSRNTRLGLGAAAILICVSLSFVAGATLDRVNSNLWFGGITYELVDASVGELEARTPYGRPKRPKATAKQLQDNL